jgi:serine/threonine protein kinase
LAVKVFRSIGSEEYQKNLEAATRETRVAMSAENRISSAERIVRTYGLVNGPVSAGLREVLGTADGSLAVGIVMRMEGGGNLASLIRRGQGSGPPLDLSEKLRLLADIAQGLAELHLAGIVHGDIKPANVLLSDDNPPKIRLADFGLSELRMRYVAIGLLQSEVLMAS